MPEPFTMAAFAYGTYRTWRKARSPKTVPRSASEPEPTFVYPTWSGDGRPSPRSSGSSTGTLPTLSRSVYEPDLSLVDAMKNLRPYVDVHEIPDILPSVVEDTPASADVPDVSDVPLSVPDVPATTDDSEVLDSPESLPPSTETVNEVQNAVPQVAVGLGVPGGHRHYGGTGGNGEGPHLGHVSFHNSWVNLTINGGTGGDGGAAGSIGGTVGRAEVQSTLSPDAVAAPAARLPRPFPLGPGASSLAA
ncbi:hypothetical protein B0H12DRAFT_746114 [Mycena haematopus]|nr:hypothetical protein B0H12DRAFT_746114 [Mycena haematopus]